MLWTGYLNFRSSRLHRFPQLNDPANTKLGQKVLRQIRARAKKNNWGQEISPWSDFFETAKQSEWLTKEMRYFNLDWLTRPTNFDKVQSGFYRDRPKGRGVTYDGLSEADRKRLKDFS